VLAERGLQVVVVLIDQELPVLREDVSGSGEQLLPRPSSRKEKGIPDTM
jgi:hypothetical protein